MSDPEWVSLGEVRGLRVNGKIAAVVWYRPEHVAVHPDGSPSPRPAGYCEIIRERMVEPAAVSSQAAWRELGRSIARGYGRWRAAAWN